MPRTQVGLQRSVDEAAGARRWSRAGVPFMVNAPGEFHVRPVTGQQRTVEVSPGVALVCGVQVTETTARSLNFDANTGTTPRYDMVVLRLEWLGLGASRATLEVRKGTTTPPVPTRVPGTTYEAVLAVIQVSPNTGQLNGSMVFQLTPHGGKAGPIYVSQSLYLAYLDIGPGTEVVTLDTNWRRRKTVGGAFDVIAADTQPWSTWNPRLRSIATGAEVILGTGGVQRGRYKVIRNMCFAEVEIRKGTSGDNFRTGDLVIDLPPDAIPDFSTSGDQGLLDQWMMGHLYTIGDGLMDWRAHVAVRTGQSYAVIFVPTSAADPRLRPWRAADASNTGGTGFPFQGGNKFSSGEVFTAVLRYALRVD